MTTIYRKFKVAIVCLEQSLIRRIRTHKIKLSNVHLKTLRYLGFTIYLSSGNTNL